MMEKQVFIIFFQGERAEVKIKKICESYGANLYPCPDSARERQEMLRQVDTRLDDLDLVLGKSIEHRKKVLLDIATHIEDWKMQVVKEKSIYHTMNLFLYDVGRKCLIAEGWCPLIATEDIQDALKRANERSGTMVPSIVNVVKTREQVRRLCSFVPPRPQARSLVASPFPAATHLLPGEQVHFFVPRHSRRLWHCPLQGSQPRRLHHRHLPLPVWHDVW